LPRCLAQLAADPLVATPLGVEPGTTPFTRPGGRASLFAIAAVENGEFVGACTLDLSAPRSRSATIGYFVGRPFWGRGYATAAVHSLVQFAFYDLRLRRVEAWVDAGNQPSRRVLVKCGFTLWPQSGTDSAPLLYTRDFIW